MLDESFGGSFPFYFAHLGSFRFFLKQWARLSLTLRWHMWARPHPVIRVRGLSFDVDIIYGPYLC